VLHVGPLAGSIEHWASGQRGNRAWFRWILWLRYFWRGSSELLEGFPPALGRWIGLLFVDSRPCFSYPEVLARCCACGSYFWRNRFADWLL